MGSEKITCAKTSSFERVSSESALSALTNTCEKEKM